MNKLLMETLLPLGYGVYPNHYSGDDDVYFVFSSSVWGADYGDDEPQCLKYLVYINLYCPHTFNSSRLIADAKEVLHGAGFTYPSETNASDAQTQHIALGCEYIAEVKFGTV